MAAGSRARGPLAVERHRVGKPSTTKLLSTGTCTFVADRPGNSNFKAALSVRKGFTVLPYLRADAGQFHSSAERSQRFGSPHSVGPASIG